MSTISKATDNSSNALLSDKFNIQKNIRYKDGIGQVMQVGNFEELMAQKGMFADLMARQVV